MILVINKNISFLLLLFIWICLFVISKKYCFDQTNWSNLSIFHLNEVLNRDELVLLDKRSVQGEGSVFISKKIYSFAFVKGIENFFFVIIIIIIHLIYLFAAVCLCVIAQWENFSFSFSFFKFEITTIIASNAVEMIKNESKKDEKKEEEKSESNGPHNYIIFFFYFFIEPNKSFNVWKEEKTSKTK